MENRACLACGQLFCPRPQNPTQTYCTKKACQQEHRWLWQQFKRDTDSDYVGNQARAQQAWLERNPDYWKHYRSAHPQYAEDNRAKQLVRNYQNRPCLIAKMAASNPPKPGLNGFLSVDPITQSVDCKEERVDRLPLPHIFRKIKTVILNHF